MPGGRMRPLKATNKAEKSVGSKPRRKRGLRVGKRRSRGCHPRRSAPIRQAPPSGFSERSLCKAIDQYDFWELRIHQLKKALVYPVSKGFKGAPPRCEFDGRLYRKFKNWYCDLRAHILKAHRSARMLVRTDNVNRDELFVSFLYREFKWVPPHRGGSEKYRSEILDDLVRLVRKDFVNPPPLSEKKRRRAEAARNRLEKKSRGATGKSMAPPCVHSSGQICRFCGCRTRPSSKSNSKRFR